MASVNKVILIGNCGRDPEVRYLPSGQAVANVSLATTSKRKDKSTGEMIEDTQWHRLQFFDRLAEIAGEYVKKGTQIYVEGRIKYGKYTGKDGVEKPTVDIVCSELTLLGSKTQGDSATPEHQPRSANPGAPAPERAPAPRQPAPKTGSGFDDMDDDIPF
jgi:single-strand DNA-binding protein